MKNPKKLRVRKDHRGEFIYRHRFVRGKQKLTKVYFVDGVPSDEIDRYQIYLDNADDITSMQDGEFAELDRRYAAERFLSSDPEDAMEKEQSSAVRTERKQYEFTSIWKELLVCRGTGIEFQLDYVMGVPTVYAPTAHAWQQRFPGSDYLAFVIELTEWCSGRGAELEFCDDAFSNTGL